MSPLLCCYISYKQKGLCDIFSIQKAVILTLANIKVLFMLDFISHLYEKHCLNMRILSKTCHFFSICINCSLKYKTLIGVHFHSCEIKTKPKEKQTKAPNVGFIYNEISQRTNPSTVLLPFFACSIAPKYKVDKMAKKREKKKEINTKPSRR